LSSFFLLLFLFINIVSWLFFYFLLLIVLWLCLIEITVKLIPSRTTLLIFLIIFLVLDISEIILPLIFPKVVFLLLLFSVHQIIHFSAPPLSKLHLLDSEILWLNLTLRRWVLVVILRIMLFRATIVITIFIRFLVWAILVLRIRSIIIIRLLLLLIFFIFVR